MHEKIMKLLAATGYAIIALFFLNGLIRSLAPIQPFWLDEWFIIHNLKFKTATDLWGKLDMMQQFPRVYLQSLKAIAGICHYNYVSLRLPSYIVHTTAVVFCFFLGRRIYKKDMLYVLLWVFIYMSFKTSLFYYVQVKQYTMEMLLGLVAIWQMIMIHELTCGNKLKPIQWFLLFFSLIIAPFFSYTYPILAGGIYLVAMLRVGIVRKHMRQADKNMVLLLVASGLVGVIIFYKVDVQHVLQDKGMQEYWKEFIMKDGFDVQLFFGNIYKLFAHLGSGALFEVIFGVLGVAGWLLGISRFREHIRSRVLTGTLTAFSTIVVSLMIVLFVMGKLPLGAHRLNAFATPLLAILCINFLVSIQEMFPKAKLAISVSIYILFLALAGNIVSSIIHSETSEQAHKERAIYNNVTQALDSASVTGLPLIVDRDITYPHDQHKEVTGDWVIETYPAYDTRQRLFVYPVDDKQHVTDTMKVNGLDSALYIHASGFERY